MPNAFSSRILNPASLLIAIGGHTGTGKSTLAHRLLAVVPFLREALVMDMDQVRREVLGYDLRVVMKPEDYSDEVTGRVRDLMNGRIAAALGTGRNVIDASGFFPESERRNIENLAGRCGASFVGLWLIASRDVLEQRINKRLAEREDREVLSFEAGHASDACPGVLDKFGDIGVPESKSWTLLDASGTMEDVLGKAVECVSYLRPLSCKI